MHPLFGPLHVHHERSIPVHTAERPDAVGAQELVFVEHLGQDPAEPFWVDQGHNPALGYAKMSRARGVDGPLEFGNPAQAFLHVSHRLRKALPRRLFDNRRGT